MFLELNPSPTKNENKMDLNKEIQAIADKVILEKAPEMIEKHISSMIDSVVKDIFCSYGDTYKELKKRIEETLQVNLEKFDLIDLSSCYGHSQYMPL